MRFDLDVEIKPGQPLLLAIEDIDEDPEQPRREFDATTLQELAETIKAVGVRQPISVRVHPGDPERWILNFGARRLRASRLAGKTEIPAFVDRTTNAYDQVIENEQRDGLRPLELALFIQKELAAGQSRSEIARRLGKSAPYVTYACALIEAPQWLLDLYRSGRCRGVHELYELRRLAVDRPEQVARWLECTENVDRGALQHLKAALCTPSQDSSAGSVHSEGAGSAKSPSASSGPQRDESAEGMTFKQVKGPDAIAVGQERGRAAAHALALEVPHSGNLARDVISSQRNGPEPRSAGNPLAQVLPVKNAGARVCVDDRAVDDILERLEQALQNLKASSAAKDFLLLARLRAALLRLARD